MPEPFVNISKFKMENAEDLHKDGGRYYRALAFFYVANFFLLPVFVVAVTITHCTKFGKRHEKTIDKFCEGLAYKRDFYKYWIYLNCNPIVWHILKD